MERETARGRRWRGGREVHLIPRSIPSPAVRRSSRSERDRLLSAGLQSALIVSHY